MNDLKTYIIRNLNGNYKLLAEAAMLPVIMVEKKSAFQLIGPKPFSIKLKCDLLNCGCRTNSFVWISHKKKAIYFESPKTGSSSLKRLLGIKAPSLLSILLQLYFEWHRVGEFEVIIRDYNNNLTQAFIQLNCLDANRIIASGPESINHPQLIDFTANNSGFLQYYGSADEALDLYHDYFSFAFIREPISRFLSNFRMFVQKDDRNMQLRTMTRENPCSVSLDDFIKIATDFHNHHWNPQYCFLPQKENLKKLSYLFELSHFNEGMKCICQRLKLDFVPVNINATDKLEDKSNKITLAQNNAIRTLYSEDYKRFNFLWENS